MESNRQQNTGVNLYDRQDSHCITVIKKDFFLTAFQCHGKNKRQTKLNPSLNKSTAVWGIVWFYPPSKRQIKTVPNL